MIELISLKKLLCKLKIISEKYKVKYSKINAKQLDNKVLDSNILLQYPFVLSLGFELVLSGYDCVIEKKSRKKKSVKISFNIFNTIIFKLLVI